MGDGLEAEPDPGIGVLPKIRPDHLAVAVFGNGDPDDPGRVHEVDGLEAGVASGDSRRMLGKIAPDVTLVDELAIGQVLHQPDPIVDERLEAQPHLLGRDLAFQPDPPLFAADDHPVQDDRAQQAAGEEQQTVTCCATPKRHTTWLPGIGAGATLEHRVEHRTDSQSFRAGQLMLNEACVVLLLLSCAKLKRRLRLRLLLLLSRKRNLGRPSSTKLKRGRPGTTIGRTGSWGRTRIPASIMAC